MAETPILSRSQSPSNLGSLAHGEAMDAESWAKVEWKRSHPVTEADREIIRAAKKRVAEQVPSQQLPSGHKEPPSLPNPRVPSSLPVAESSTPNKLSRLIYRKRSKDTSVVDTQPDLSAEVGLGNVSRERPSIESGFKTLGRIKRDRKKLPDLWTKSPSVLQAGKTSDSSACLERKDAQELTGSPLTVKRRGLRGLATHSFFGSSRRTGKLSSLGKMPEATGSVESRVATGMAEPNFSIGSVGPMASTTSLEVNVSEGTVESEVSHRQERETLSLKEHVDDTYSEVDDESQVTSPRGKEMLSFKEALDASLSDLEDESKVSSRKDKEMLSFREALDASFSELEDDTESESEEEKAGMSKRSGRWWSVGRKKVASKGVTEPAQSKIKVARKKKAESSHGDALTKTDDEPTDVVEPSKKMNKFATLRARGTERLTTRPKGFSFHAKNLTNIFKPDNTHAAEPVPRRLRGSASLGALKSHTKLTKRQHAGSPLFTDSVEYIPSTKNNPYNTGSEKRPNRLKKISKASISTPMFPVIDSSNPDPTLERKDSTLKIKTPSGSYNIKPKKFGEDNSYNSPVPFDSGSLKTPSHKRHGKMFERTPIREPHLKFPLDEEGNSVVASLDPTAEEETATNLQSEMEYNYDGANDKNETQSFLTHSDSNKGETANDPVDTITEMIKHKHKLSDITEKGDTSSSDDNVPESAPTRLLSSMPLRMQKRSEREIERFDIPLPDDAHANVAGILKRIHDFYEANKKFLAPHEVGLVNWCLEDWVKGLGKQEADDNVSLSSMSSVRDNVLDNTKGEKLYFDGKPYVPTIAESSTAREKRQETSRPNYGTHAPHFLKLQTRLIAEAFANNLSIDDPDRMASALNLAAPPQVFSRREALKRYLEAYFSESWYFAPEEQRDVTVFAKAVLKGLTVREDEQTPKGKGKEDEGLGAHWLVLVPNWPRGRDKGVDRVLEWGFGLEEVGGWRKVGPKLAAEVEEMFWDRYAFSLDEVQTLEVGTAVKAAVVGKPRVVEVKKGKSKEEEEGPGEKAGVDSKSFL